MMSIICISILWTTVNISILTSWEMHIHVAFSCGRNAHKFSTGEVKKTIKLFSKRLYSIGSDFVWSEKARLFLTDYEVLMGVQREYLPRCTCSKISLSNQIQILSFCTFCWGQSLKYPSFSTDILLHTWYFHWHVDKPKESNPRKNRTFSGRLKVTDLGFGQIIAMSFFQSDNSYLFIWSMNVLKWSNMLDWCWNGCY